MSKLDDLIREIQNELGADLLFIGVAGTDGLPIAGAKFMEIDADAIAARYSLIVKLAERVAGKMNLGEVEDNLITVSGAYSMLYMLGDGSYFAYIGLNQEAPIGVFRMVMKEYSEKLWDAIPR